METNNHYNKSLKPLAHNLRNNSTKAEVRLWCELLSGKRLGGLSFRRQRPIGAYIADFMCPELKLIIEVDGYSHHFKTEADIERDMVLKEQGFTVLRFSDSEVMKDLPNVQRTLEIWIEQNRSK
jgi:very-short-patch-repair endonuclease